MHQDAGVRMSVCSLGSGVQKGGFMANITHNGHPNHVSLSMCQPNSLQTLKRPVWHPFATVMCSAITQCLWLWMIWIKSTLICKVWLMALKQRMPHHMVNNTDMCNTLLQMLGIQALNCWCLCALSAQTHPLPSFGQMAMQLALMEVQMRHAHPKNVCDHTRLCGDTHNSCRGLPPKRTSWQWSFSNDSGCLLVWLHTS